MNDVELAVDMYAITFYGLNELDKQESNQTPLTSSNNS